MDHAIVLLKGRGSLADARRKGKKTKIETKTDRKKKRKVFFKSRKACFMKASEWSIYKTL